MKDQSKRLKLQAKEDRISDLPDSLIQYILSLLPSTREAIHTSLLSKTWRYQWTRVPALIFHSSGMSTQKFSTFINNTLLLYDCSNIQKFHIQSDDYYYTVEDPNWNQKIHFALGKDVEDLILELHWFCDDLKLSELLFNNTSLKKLRLCDCTIVSIPNSRVSWGNLTTLSIEYCMLPDQAIENILRGSPSLESFELTCRSVRGDQVIASRSLKKLVLTYGYLYALEVLCPNLEEFKLFGHVSALAGLKLMYWSSLICATLDFDLLTSYGDYEEFEIIEHLRHVNELKFGSRYIETLSDCKVEASLSSLLLNNKSLILDNPNFEKHSAGIACALHSSYVLEKLVIKLQVYKPQGTMDVLDLNIPGENYWNSNKTVFNCLTSHLKTVEIDGLSESDDNCMLVLNFVEFLLNNANVLEKLVVILKDGGNDFETEVSQNLSNFPRCSQHAIVELVCSN